MVMRLVLNDDGQEVEEDDGFPDEASAAAAAADAAAIERGDFLAGEEEEFLEVDEEIIASLADDKGKAGNGTIPKARFDEVVAERNALRDQIAATPATAVPATVATPAAEEAVVFDVDAKENDYAEALVEGDLDKAKAIRKEIREYERAALKDELRQETSTAREVATIEERKQAVINQAFTDHPQLSAANTDVYDQALVDKINLMAQAYVSRGKTADAALAAAIDDFLPKVEVKADPAAVAAVATATAISRNRAATAASRQAPALGGVGVGARAASDTVNVADMSEEEFRALPDREKKRLRGD